MDSRVPKYAQIKQDIVKSIERGELKPGEQVASESVLREQYGVSAITVRRAFSDLIAEGYLTGVQGLGTFVAKKRMNRGLTSICFSDELLEQGYRIDMVVDRIEAVRDKKIAEVLELAPGHELTKVCRVRVADGEPVAYQCSYVSSDRLSVEQAQRIRSTGSFYKTLSDAGSVPAWASENYSVRPVTDPHIAEMMEIPQGTDAFFVRRIAYDETDAVIEYAETHFNKDWYSVTVNIKV